MKDISKKRLCGQTKYGECKPRVLFEMYVLVRKIIAENPIWKPVDYRENIVKQMKPDSQWTISLLTDGKKSRDIFFVDMIGEKQ